MSDDPETLLTEAHRLLATPSPELGGTWPRAVALLVRQALETALDDFWRWKAPGAQMASRNAQVICVRAFLSDGAISLEARSAWHSLSRFCHHHVYELAPTAEELHRTAESVERFLKALRAP